MEAIPMHRDDAPAKDITAADAKARRALIDEMLEAHLGYETWSHLSVDHREAVNAFLEKRAPVFTGN